MQEPALLRTIIASATAATLLYTPVLKRIPFIKNVTVASVIAFAPLAGSLAAGAVRAEPDGYDMQAT